MKEQIKQRMTLENVLCVFIVLCPILDMLSFIFRNIYETKFSPSTFIRPIIPIIIICYLFFKEKIKVKTLIVGVIYAIYVLIHLYLFKINLTNNAFGGLLHELQYLINYSYMILNLFIYVYIFKNKEITKLKVSVLVAMSIYIISIYISIFTNTSSSTYIEGMGYKGWFESGNSISSILILSLFLTINMVKNKKYRYWIVALTILIGIYLTTLIGTRVRIIWFYFGSFCLCYL